MMLDPGVHMADQIGFEMSLGLSEEEKRDLEKMIGEFQKERVRSEQPFQEQASIQEQIDAINKRLAYLTSMFLTMDKRMAPLYETIRLTFQKSEILNQRINALIESLRSGEPLR
jgi:hypothetical protein